MSEMIRLVTDQDLSNRGKRPRPSAQHSALALCKRITCSILNIAVQEIELLSAQRRATQIFYADSDVLAALGYTPQRRADAERPATSRGPSRRTASAYPTTTSRLATRLRCELEQQKSATRAARSASSSTPRESRNKSAVIK
jgi:hypothetical protein